jgi:leader peptidase (prepilin peptidase) / N-methyltransferase
MGIELFFIICFGLCFGSLNTLLIHRLPEGKPIGMTRSQCPRCKTALTPLDLVPLFSWLCSGGKCRHCKTNVHWRYPVIECITAATFVLAYAFYGFSVNGALIALLGSQIIVLCIIDFQHRIIPDELQISMAITGIIYCLYNDIHIMTMLAGMLIGGGLGLALQRLFRWWKKQEGLGTGDVKFMAVSGIWLGAEVLIPFFFYGGVFGIISALLWRMIHPDPRFPFGPALAISLFILVLHPSSDLWFLQLSFWLVTILRII